MFVFPIMGWMIIHIPWFGPWHISCSLIPVCTCSWISSLSKFGHGSSRPALQAWTPLFVAVAGRFKPTWGTVRIAGASGKPPEWKIRRENGEVRAEKTKLGRWERCFNLTINHKQWLHICKWSLSSMPPKSIHCSLVSMGTDLGLGIHESYRVWQPGSFGRWNWWLCWIHTWYLPFLTHNWKNLNTASCVDDWFFTWPLPSLKRGVSVAQPCITGRGNMNTQQPQWKRYVWRSVTMMWHHLPSKNIGDPTSRGFF